MPVNITNATTGVTQSHKAERVQITNLSVANEDVSKMQVEGYFTVSTYLGNEKIAEVWDNQPLVFDCTDDPELRSAMETIQSRMGQKRYAQVMATLKSPTKNS